MPCLVKALTGWLILLVVSGAVGLFLRQALFGLLVPFPAESTNPAVAAALRDTHRRLKRGNIASGRRKGSELTIDTFKRPHY
jgi:cytoskeletal protein RodZ